MPSRELPFLEIQVSLKLIVSSVILLKCLISRLQTHMYILYMYSILYTRHQYITTQRLLVFTSE